MIIINGTIKVESMDEVERVRAALVARAEKSRADDGNIDYVFCQNLEDPTEIRLIELWESEAQLEAHLAVPDEAFSAAIGSARIERAMVKAHDADTGRVLMER